MPIDSSEGLPYPTIAFHGDRKELDQKLGEVILEIRMLAGRGNLYAPDINSFPFFGTPIPDRITNTPHRDSIYTILTSSEAAALEMLNMEISALVQTFRDTAGYSHVGRKFLGDEVVGQKIMTALDAPSPEEALDVLGGLADFAREIAYGVARSRGKNFISPDDAMIDTSYIKALRSDNWRIGAQTLNLATKLAKAQNRPIVINEIPGPIMPVNYRTALENPNQPLPSPGWERSIHPYQEQGVDIAAKMYHGLYEYMQAQGLGTQFEIKPDVSLQKIGFAGSLSFK